MNAKRLSLIIFLLLLLGTNLLAIKLRWAVEDGVKYKVKSFVHEQRFLNSKYHSTVEIKNKAVLTAILKKDDAVCYKGDFYYYERAYGGTNSTFNLIKIYPSKFWRDSLGRYKIEKKYFMPVVRDVPVFPKKDIKKGESWTAKGVEFHDLHFYGITNGYKIPINVHYTYLDDNIQKGKRIIKLLIKYKFSHKSNIDLVPIAQKRKRQIFASYSWKIASYKYRQEMQKLSQIPKVVSGECHQIYYWDLEAGLPYQMSERFHFIFDLYSGEKHEFKGSSAAIFTKVKFLTKKKETDLVKQLKKSAGKKAVVKLEKRGIVIRFNNILFDYKKHKLTTKAKKNLLKFVAILKKHNKYDIRIEGHTDNIGDIGYNKTLSDKRAKAVSQFLANMIGIDKKKVAWIGKGEKNPIASNKTKKGRAMNRRVEIILLTNE